MVMMSRQVIHRIIGVFQFNITRHVTVVVLFVTDAVAGHHQLLVVTLASASATGRRRGSTTSIGGSRLRLTVGRLIFRTFLAILLDSFVLRSPILEPNFDLFRFRIWSEKQANQTQSYSNHNQ